MTKAEMEVIWNGPLQDALNIKHWNKAHVYALRHDGVLPNPQPKPAKKRK